MGTHKSQSRIRVCNSAQNHHQWSQPSQILKDFSTVISEIRCHQLWRIRISYVTMACSPLTTMEFFCFLIKPYLYGVSIEHLCPKSSSWSGCTKSIVHVCTHWCDPFNGISLYLHFQKLWWLLTTTASNLVWYFFLLCSLVDVDGVMDHSPL